MAEFVLSAETLNAGDVREELALALGTMAATESLRPDLSRVRQMADQALGADPENAEALFISAFIAKLTGEKASFDNAWKILSKKFKDDDKAVGLLTRAVWMSGLVNAVPDVARMWQRLSPGNSEAYSYGATAAKLGGDIDSFVSFVEDARRNLATPVHLPTAAAAGPEFFRERDRLQREIPRSELTPVSRRDGMVAIREYFAEMDVASGQLNPKGSDLPPRTIPLFKLESGALGRPDPAVAHARRRPDRAFLLSLSRVPAACSPMSCAA